MDSPEVAAAIRILIFVVGYWFGYMQCKRRYRSMMEILRNKEEQTLGEEIVDGLRELSETVATGKWSNNRKGLGVSMDIKEIPGFHEYGVSPDGRIWSQTGLSYKPRQN